MSEQQKPRRYGVCRNAHSETAEHMWGLLRAGKINEWIRLNTEEPDGTGCMIWSTGLETSRNRRAPEVHLPRDLPAPNWPHTKQVRAARLVWETINNRATPEGMVIFAACLNKQCIAPKHLVCGTKADYGAARAAAGKARLNVSQLMRATAKRRARSDMTPAIAQAIRDHMDAVPKGQRTQEYRALAERYGVAVRRIELIAQGVTWKPEAVASPFQGLFSGLISANDGAKRAA